MEKYLLYTFVIALSCFVFKVTIELIKLFSLWLQFKLQNIKNKEYTLWD